MKKQKPNAQRSPKRRVSSNPKPNPKKPTYQIRNWKKYNAALVARGSVTLWMEDEVLQNWKNQQLTGRRGASLTYNEVAILTPLTLKVVYHLPLRATQGLLCSLLRLLDMAHLPVPDYSTLSRRQKTLEVALPRQTRFSTPHDFRPDQVQGLHLVVDSTGCKVYGEGEWKVRQHGYSKRRTWRKLHLGVDKASGEILAAVLTTNDVADSAVLEDLLEQAGEPVTQVSGDGGYDKRPCYEALRRREKKDKEVHSLPVEMRVSIPPRHGARIWQHGNCKAERLARDENLRRIRQIGRCAWKVESGYHRRSLVETTMFRTTMFRVKSLFGDKLSARCFEAQAAEAFIRCAALNKMTRLGMPDSYPV